MSQRKYKGYSREVEDAHCELLRKKKERLEGLRALCAVWEPRASEDPEYFQQLTRKTAKLENEINVMAVIL